MPDKNKLERGNASNSTDLFGSIDTVLDSEEPERRVELIDDLIHRLNFLRRLTLLTPNQIEHMQSTETLNDACRARLDQAEGTPLFDDLIEEYARSNYFRECAWVKYMNEGGKPPCPPEPPLQND